MNLLTFLSALSKMRVSLRGQANHIEQLKAKAEGGAVDYEKVKVNGTFVNTSDLEARLADCKTEYEANLKTYKSWMQELALGISLLPNKQERIVLQGMYLHLDSLKKVSDKLHIPLMQADAIAHRGRAALDTQKEWY